MAKPYKPVIYYKDYTPEEFTDYIDEHHKIGLNRVQFLSDNAHEKYPLISKTDFNLIVKEMWIVLRRYILQGYVFHLGEFFNSLKIAWRLQNAKEFIKITGAICVRHKFKYLWSEERMKANKIINLRTYKKKLRNQ
jgi:hypothetical protein